MYLPTNVFFCVTGDVGVFLDLRNDTYKAVKLESGSGFAPAPDELAALLAPHREILASADLITASAEGSHALNDFASIPQSRLHLMHPDDRRHFGIGRISQPHLKVGAHDVFDVYRACAGASRSLRRRSIVSVVNRIRTMKARAAEQNNVHELRAHVGAFLRLRPWYPRQYLCLFDSLALMTFLANRRVVASWIFGVQMQPFNAHCWVEAEGYVLNEGTEQTTQFTPIMMV